LHAIARWNSISGNAICSWIAGTENLNLKSAIRAASNGYYQLEIACKE